MPTLFAQNTFLGGLNTEFDPTKLPGDSYPLLINGRVRNNTVVPTPRHLQISGPEGLYQGLYAVGKYIVLFVSGVAYYADVSESPITLHPVPGWSALDSAANRIYAELISATNNFFNRTGSPDDTTRSFNNTIAAFQQALLVFDGVSEKANAIFPNGTTRQVNSFAEWSKDNPEYVPKGLLPATLGAKLFLVGPDRRKIYHSVSGRMTDFMVNIDPSGNAGGDASTVATAVSFNEITSIRPISSGQLLVSTLYASFVIDLDYTQPIFGEPYLIPNFLFPVGCVNEISTIDVLADTAFITQSGIHTFNAVTQALRESNNFPFGAPIRGLLRNPQMGNCTGLFDDYALFAMNTVFGSGVIVYDTIRQAFQSLDLSFGAVKQFASTRLEGLERLFYITHENEIYEAFAGSGVNTTMIYVGEWSAPQASQDSLLHMIDLSFTNIADPGGNVRIISYADRAQVDEVVLALSGAGYTNNYPIPVPFTPQDSAQSVGWQFPQKIKAWKNSFLIGWDFSAALAQVCVDGELQQSDNTALEPNVTVDSQSFAFIADSGYDDELNPGGSFLDGDVLCVQVTKGAKYIYNANGDGDLVTGNVRISSGIFTALADYVAINGTGTPAFSLRTATNFMSVLGAIDYNTISAIIGGGDHSYPNGSQLDVAMGFQPIRPLFIPVLGNHDWITENGKYFCARAKTSRYFTHSFVYVDFFFYNGNPTEPDGIDSSSAQASWLKAALGNSSALYKIVVCHFPPYTSDVNYSPGITDLRLPYKAWGASAVLSGHGHSMERTVINGFPYLVCGTGGHSLRSFADGTSGVSAFRQNTQYGYLSIKTDPIACVFEFRNTDNTVLDTYAVYA